MSTQDPSTPADTRLKRFARNFRNMGTVEGYELNEDTNTVTVRTNSRGFSPLNLLEKGWDFDLHDVTEDNGQIITVLKLN
jgi:hypothetical protein